VRNFVALLASVIVLAGLSLLAEAIFPSVQYQSGNHEIATTIALGCAFLTWVVVYTLYPRLRRGGGKS
jgi:hypothetical protein